MKSKHHVLDQIIQAVEKGGSHEIPFEVLKNDVFRQTHVPRRTTKEQLLVWAMNKGLLYEFQEKPTGQSVLFYR